MVYPIGTVLILRAPPSTSLVLTSPLYLLRPKCTFVTVWGGMGWIMEIKWQSKAFHIHFLPYAVHPTVKKP
ncbi:hypothetical protein L2E82_15794 [Cichorium intybus]|uniref:Uncharacterized protein n=1 Tax=Cichorium intybus TaxID=13427 RepID=A0ACB9F486_CICIN|nr:hypothetical protein L2E82_15794 [Cichorium intybus]